MFFSTTRTLPWLRQQHVAIRKLIDGPNLFVESKISAWTPAEHLDHLIKVGTAMFNRLLQSDVKRLTRGISPVGRIILTLGRIPRGLGKAPERVRGLRATAEELRASLEHLDALLATFNTTHLDAARGAIVPHPRFGGLTPAQTLRFAAIHNDHHLRIIADVIQRR
jgi:hypothetical protein